MKSCKVEIFIPESHLSQLQEALQRVDAGHIGDYDSCLSYSEVIGTWRSLDGAKPYIGKQNEICQAPELKVEVLVGIENLPDTLEAIKKIHPYETPVINIIPLLNEENI